MTILLRPATESDSELLLRWRNDPVTRANSRRQQPLSWAELTEAPPGVRRETYLAELRGTPVGTVRLDYRGQECELSWTIAPEKRGKGIGRRLVEAAIRQASAAIVIAEIKSDNLPSLRIAERVGFRRDGERDGLQRWRLEKPQAAASAVSLPRRRNDGAIGRARGASPR